MTTRGADGRYEIGRRIWLLGSLSALSRELRAIALPFMQDLSATTGENVHIAVLDGDRVVADVRVDDALVARHQGERVDEKFARLGSAFFGPVFVELLQRLGH